MLALKFDDDFNNHDFSDEKSRKGLAKMVMRLFAKWQLDTASQLRLMGLSPTSRTLLVKYRDGTSPIANTQDSIDRVCYLLVIYQSLKLLYPKNEELCHTWIKRKNKAFDNYTPLEIMLKHGIIGFEKVATYLSFLKEY